MHTLHSLMAATRARRASFQQLLLVLVPALVSALSIPFLAFAQVHPGGDQAAMADVPCDFAAAPPTPSFQRSNPRVISAPGSSL